MSVVQSLLTLENIIEIKQNRNADLGLIILFAFNKLCTLEHDFKSALFRAVYIGPRR